MHRLGEPSSCEVLLSNRHRSERLRLWRTRILLIPIALPALSPVSQAMVHYCKLRFVPADKVLYSATKYMTQHFAITNDYIDSTCAAMYIRSNESVKVSTLPAARW
jgi:hypothetical protein